MNKENWTTIVFALEQYIQECERDSGFANAHTYQTLWASVKEMENAK